MKKSLIALAVLAAAGAASAQSSVTLFGVVDATLAFGKGEVGDKHLADQLGLQQLAYRLPWHGRPGRRHVRVLLAGSRHHQRRRPGAATSTNNQPSAAPPAPPFAGTQGLTFNRRSTVSLAGGWGELRLGRDYTPQFWNLTVFDPFGTNGVGQTVTTVATTHRARSAATPFRPTPSAPALRTPSATSCRATWAASTARPCTTWVKTPKARRPKTTAPAPACASAGLPVRSTLLRHTPRPPTSHAGDVTTANVGGSLDFGFATIMGQYNQVEFDSATFGDPEAKGWLVGGLIPIGAGEIRLAYSALELEAELWQPGSREGLHRLRPQPVQAHRCVHDVCFPEEQGRLGHSP